jgi:hypothetical protein
MKNTNTMSKISVFFIRFISHLLKTFFRGSIPMNGPSLLLVVGEWKKVTNTSRRCLPKKTRFSLSTLVPKYGNVFFRYGGDSSSRQRDSE